MQHAYIHTHTHKQTHTQLTQHTYTYIHANVHVHTHIRTTRIFFFCLLLQALGCCGYGPALIILRVPMSAINCWRVGIIGAPKSAMRDLVPRVLERFACAFWFCLCFVLFSFRFLFFSFPCALLLLLLLLLLFVFVFVFVFVFSFSNSLSLSLQPTTHIVIFKSSWQGECIIIILWW